MPAKGAGSGARCSFHGYQPMGDAKCGPFRPPAHPYLRVESRGARVSSEGGRSLLCELDERRAPSALIEQPPRSPYRTAPPVPPAGFGSPAHLLSGAQVRLPCARTASFGGKAPALVAVCSELSRTFASHSAAASGRAGAVDQAPREGLPSAPCALRNGWLRAWPTARGGGDNMPMAELQRSRKGRVGAN